LAIGSGQSIALIIEAVERMMAMKAAREWVGGLPPSFASASREGIELQEPRKKDTGSGGVVRPVDGTITTRKTGRSFVVLQAWAVETMEP
jgi:hypothetical protein